MEDPQRIANRTKANGQAGSKRRQGQQFEGGFGHDRQQALRAGQEPRDVEAGLVFVRPATELHDGAAGQDSFEAENVIASDSVFEATRPAGIGSDISANKTFRAAGGVRRVIEPALFNGVLEVFGDDTRLNDRYEIGGIDFFNAV